ncbi:MAG TPA: hypothetical protein DCS93_41200, partial [Microscillaceae bacterium]|nr:hypothetical protein [Microscillaceae bacterium]
KTFFISIVSIHSMLSYEYLSKPLPTSNNKQSFEYTQSEFLLKYFESVTKDYFNMIEEFENMVEKNQLF